MVTHDPNAASYADRVVFLADGTHRRRTARPDRRGGARPAQEPRRRRPEPTTDTDDTAAVADDPGDVQEPALPQAAAGPVGHGRRARRSRSSRARWCSPTPWAARSTTCSRRLREHRPRGVGKPTLECQRHPVPRAGAGVGRRRVERGVRRRRGRRVRRRSTARWWSARTARCCRNQTGTDFGGELDWATTRSRAARGHGRRRPTTRSSSTRNRQGRRATRSATRSPCGHAASQREPFKVVGIAGYTGGRDSLAGETSVCFTDAAGPAAHARRDRHVQQHRRRGRRRRVGHDRPERPQADALGADYQVETGEELAKKSAAPLKTVFNFFNYVLLGFAGGGAAGRHLPDPQHVLDHRGAADPGTGPACGRWAPAGAR